MNHLDLKGLTRSDLVEYQRPSHTTTACGTFQGWYSTSDGVVRLIARNLELGLDILVDPQRVIDVTLQSEGHHEP
jgi:hypothetical protein